MRSAPVDHSALIEQLERWASELHAALKSFTTDVNAINGVIVGMQQVATDLARDSAPATDEEAHP